MMIPQPPSKGACAGALAAYLVCRAFQMGMLHFATACLVKSVEGSGAIDLVQAGFRFLAFEHI